jgi:hypothetical protein
MQLTAAKNIVWGLVGGFLTVWLVARLPVIFAWLFVRLPF